MPVVIVVGIQWGDEGKGKVVDYLTEDATLVVRFQGGNNAGHTVIAEGQKTALKLIPSGILRKKTRCLLASGVVIDPEALLEEIRGLAKVGIHVTAERFGIAGEAQLIMPYHKAIDHQRESNKKEAKIGTTGRGIGPCYEDAVSRHGIRVADLFNSQQLKVLVERNVADKNKYLANVIGSDQQFNAAELYGRLQELAAEIAPFVTDVGEEVDSAIIRDEFVMFEGAQGCLLDINHGTYPFVTSSNTVAGFACVSAGFGPMFVDMVVGICKAYCTRVGSGPFPTEDLTEDGETLRKVGNEFGTVTARPRRCGWFDAVAVRKAIRLNGVNKLILTKLDVLSGFETIKIGVGYKLNGEQLQRLPFTAADLESVEAIYQELPGWQDDITAVRTFDDLPKNAQKFIRLVEELSDCEVAGFSVGPDREQTIINNKDLVKCIE